MHGLSIRREIMNPKIISPNQVKRQALLELQRAVGAAETKALELVAAERGKMERLVERRHSPPPGRDLSPSTAGQQNVCHFIC